MILWERWDQELVFFWLSRELLFLNGYRLILLTYYRIIYGYFEMAAKEGDMAGLKGMVMG